MPKIISGLNSAAATLSSLSVAVHTHTHVQWTTFCMTIHVAGMLLLVMATACFEVSISSWCMYEQKKITNL